MYTKKDTVKYLPKQIKKAQNENIIIKYLYKCTWCKKFAKTIKENVKKTPKKYIY